MSGQAANAPLAIGEPSVLWGRFVAHWEWSRFEIAVERRRFGTRLERCLLLPVDGIPQSPFEVAGVALPADWRHHGGLVFDVGVKATPIERGRFGHRGTLRWKVRVDEWIEVTLVDPRGRKPR